MTCGPPDPDTTEQSTYFSPLTLLQSAGTLLAQMYFDYKKAQADNQQDHIYTITSACCSTVIESEHGTDK